MDNLKDKWFYFPVVGLLVIFILKFISFLEILDYFSINNDLTYHLSMLYLLASHGFHSFISNWYNGFILFQIYPPGWFFFSLPVYWLTNNLQLTALISLILMLILGFIASCLIFKQQSFSKKIIFFVFFFMSPIMIDYIFSIGRFPELFAWVIFLFIFYLIFKYKNKEIDKFGFILFTIFTSIIILSHQYVAIFALFLIFLIFLIKSTKEKFLIILVLFIVLLLTSFFWIEFVKTIINNPYAIDPTAYQKGNLLTLGSILSFNTFVLLPWFIIFYFYNKSFIKSKKNKIFFYPILILSVLVITRLVCFIPILKEIPPNSYNLFFISLSMFMIFKIKFPNNLRKLIIVCLLLIPFLTSILVFNIGFNFRPERQFQHTELQKEIISLFPRINERYIIIDNSKLSVYNRLVGIATIQYNLSTPQGIHEALMSKQLQRDFITLNEALKNGDCKSIKNNFKNLDIKYVIASYEDCKEIKKCNLKLIEEKQYACLYFIDN